MAPAYTPGMTTAPERPPTHLGTPLGDGLLRARVAGLALVAASGGQLLATGLAAAETYDLAVLSAAVATLAWLPGLHGLEHFLKRRAEALSLVALAAGTTGVIAVLCGAARGSAAGPGDVPVFPWTWILGARVALPVSLALFGAGVAGNRLLPPWAAWSLAGGGLVQALNWSGALSLPGLVDQGLVFLGAAWLGGHLLLDPGSWFRGKPKG